jgi:hypothetical protein
MRGIFDDNILKMADHKENMPMQPEEMYNISNRYYDWEKFRYSLPRHYHQNPPAKTPPPRALLKTNYIDDVLKIKKGLPAPNAYSPNSQYRPLSGKLDKNPRRTQADVIIERGKLEKSPGPATYNPRPQTATALNKNGPEQREHYLNEIEYLSAENPGVGEYNLTHLSHVASPKFKRPATAYEVLKPQKSKPKSKHKEDLSKTLVPGTFDWLAAQKRPPCKNFFGKSRRFV